MKKNIFKSSSIFFKILVLLLMISCDSDDEGVISDSPVSVSLGDFLESSPQYGGFLQAANESAIPFELAQRFNLSPVSLDELSGLAIRTVGENGEENDYYSVLDLLSITDAEFTIFVPSISVIDSRETPLNIEDLLDIRSSLTNEQRAERRAEIGNLLLYHIIEGRKSTEDLECAEIPLSSGGGDEISIVFEADDDTGTQSILLNGGFRISSGIENLDDNLMNGSFNLINGALEVTAATPIPVLANPFVQVADNGSLALRYSRKLNEESVNNTLPSSYSILADGNTISISSVSLDPEDGSVIILQPSETLGNSLQDVTLNYSGSTVMSQLDGIAPTFSDLIVRLNAENVIDLIANFEIQDEVTTAFQINESRAGRTQERSFNGGFSLRVSNVVRGTITSGNPTGNFSGDVNYAQGSRLRTRRDFPASIPIDVAATYRFEFALFIEDLPVVDATNPSEFRISIQHRPGGNGFVIPDVVSAGVDERFIIDPVNNPVKGRWQLIKRDIPGSALVNPPATNYRIFIRNADRMEPNPFLFYIDDIRMYQLD